MDNTIILPQSLTLSTVAKTAESIKKVIALEDKIILNAQNVQEIDALGLQLILSVQKTGLLNNLRVEVVNIGPRLQRIFSLSSLS